MTKVPRAKGFLGRHTTETTVGQVDVQAGSFELHVRPDGDFTAKLNGEELSEINELVLSWKHGELFVVRIGRIVDPRINLPVEITLRERKPHA